MRPKLHECTTIFDELIDDDNDETSSVYVVKPHHASSFRGRADHHVGRSAVALLACVVVSFRCWVGRLIDVVLSIRVNFAWYANDTRADINKTNSKTQVFEMCACVCVCLVIYINGYTCTYAPISQSLVFQNE